MRVLFLGTPDFAVKALESILDNGYDVIGVVTQPDRKRNRGEVTFCPVKQFALDRNIKVYQYESIRKEGAEELAALAPDIMVTCAFGQIISQQILDIPPHGVINIHASLLPKYRGSSPIQWCLVNGEEKTGITVMRTALAVDSGDILLQKELDILPNENAGHLFDRLAILGGQAIVEALELIESGRDEYVSQDESLATHYPMINKEDGKIDWQASARDIYNKMRGFTPWPSVYTHLDGKIFKILDARAEKTPEDMQILPVGAVRTRKSSASVKTGDGVLTLLSVQLEGKRAMDIKTFMLSGKLIDGEEFDR